MRSGPGGDGFGPAHHGGAGAGAGSPYHGYRLRNGQSPGKGSAPRRDGPRIRIREGRSLRRGHHPPGGHQLLRDRQRGPDPLSGRSALSSGRAAGAPGEPGCLCGKVQGHPHPGLYPLSARPAGHSGQAGGLMDAGPGIRSGRDRLCRRQYPVPGLPGHHGHRSQLSGAVRRGRGEDR